MRELSLVAVGSSRVIAAEIKEITEALLGTEFSVAALAVDEVTEAYPDTFYICATTQRERLSGIVPANRLFVYELHPTTLFFLAIAKIPAGTDVFVFNNRSPYIALLSKECNQLGIETLRFHPVPYEEMPDAEVREHLREARYIIGVDCMVGKKVLLSGNYRDVLRPDAKIIAGKRAASVASASRLIDGIAAFYCEALAEVNGHEKNAAAPKVADILVRKAAALLVRLKAASMRMVTNRIGSAMTALPEAFTLDDRAEPSAETLQGQINALRYLQKKLRELEM